MASTQKIISQGFGVGSTYGTPTTIGLAPSSTLSITSSLVGDYLATVGMVAGINLITTSTSNGVTLTVTALAAAPGRVFLDGVSNFLVSSTTSVNVLFIGT